MSKFSEYTKSNQPKTNNVTNKKMEQNDIQDMLEKYSQLRKDELMSEFLRASKQKKMEGGLSDEECNKLDSVLSPYLSTEQKKTMQELLERGKNV